MKSDFKMSRRDFLKLCGLTAATLGLSELYVPQIASALEKVAAGQPPVIWLQGQTCSGCSISLLNTVHPEIDEILLHIISLAYHPIFMAATGHQAIEALQETATANKGKFILIVEGAIPTAKNGIYATLGERNGKPLALLNWVRELSEGAMAVVAVGTCAAYGGIPAAQGNVTGAKGVGDVLAKKVINVLGCPAHPDWILGTLVYLLMFGVPKLDKYSRPAMFFPGRAIHYHCENRGYFEDDEYAEDFGEEGCKFKLGCKGLKTSSDCPIRKWNNGVSWCMGAGGLCIGCVEPVFPDGMAPFYKPIPEEELEKLE